MTDTVTARRAMIAAKKNEQTSKEPKKDSLKSADKKKLAMIARAAKY